MRCIPFKMRKELTFSLCGKSVLFVISCKFLTCVRSIPKLCLYNIVSCLFSHDVTKIQTTKLSILLGFYFHDALEQLKTNFHTNFRFKRFLGFVLGYA